jgi:hypothetical protein
MDIMDHAFQLWVPRRDDASGETERKSRMWLLEDIVDSELSELGVNKMTRFNDTIGRSCRT